MLYLSTLSTDQPNSHDMFFKRRAELTDHFQNSKNEKLHANRLQLPQPRRYDDGRTCARDVGGR